MLPHFNGLEELAKFTSAISIVSGLFAWWHPSDPKGDEIWIQATDELIEGVTNSDQVEKIKDKTLNDLRDQVSLEQIEEWRKEQDFRKWRNRN